MSDYIYTNGELYNVDELAHANFKYIKRIPNGKGGWKYIYDVDLLKSNLKNVKNKAVNKARDVIGYDEKEAYEKAKSEADKSKTAYYEAKTQRDAAKAVAEKSKSTLSDALRNGKTRTNLRTGQNSYTKKAQKEIDKAKANKKAAEDRVTELEKKMLDTGYAEKVTAKNVNKHYYDKTILGKYERSKAILEKNREERAERREARKAYKAYKKAEWENSDLKKKIDMQTAKAVNKARDIIGYDEKERYERAKLEEEIARPAYEKAKAELDQKRTELDKKRADVKNASGTKAYKKANKAYKKAFDDVEKTSDKVNNMNYGEKQWQVERSKSDYDRTLLSKVEQIKAGLKSKKKKNKKNN